MGAGGTVGLKAKELCDPWLDFECERIILTRINPNGLMPIIVGLGSGIHVGYHLLLFIWEDFYKKSMAWDWRTLVKAGFNTNILLSMAFKGAQFLFFLLSFIDPSMAWWFMTISQVNVLGDFTWHLVGSALWMEAIAVDYVSVTGTFQWQFWGEWGLILFMWLLDMMTAGGLVDWYFYGIMKQTDDKFCNVWHEDCD